MWQELVEMRLEREGSGAQVSQEQFDKIMGLIDTGVKQGAKLETGGKRHGAPSLPHSAAVLASHH